MDKILVGIVCTEDIKAHFAMTLRDAQYGNGYFFDSDERWAIGYITDDGRNTVAEEAIQNQYDYLVFLDSDMIFNRGVVLSMYNRAKSKGAVSACIYNTRSDHRVNLYNWNKKTGAFKSIKPNLEYGGICDVAGTGAICIPVNLLSKIEFPYFQYTYSKSTKGKRMRWSEDMYFGKKMTDKGYRVNYCPVVCEHIVTNVVKQTNSTDYELLKLSGECYAK